MTSSSSEIAYWPDLQALGMHITADYAAGRVNVSATTNNIGFGTAYGPFIIAVQVTIVDDTGTTEHYREFEVPSDVIIYGRPLYELAARTSAPEHAPAREGASAVVIPPWLHRSYTTGVMSVPLEFVDVNHANYSASFIVDPYFQVTDYNRTNNSYPPIPFFFLSPSGQARARKEPLIVKRSLVRQ